MIVWSLVVWDNLSISFPLLPPHRLRRLATCMSSTHFMDTDILLWCFYSMSCIGIWAQWINVGIVATRWAYYMQSKQSEPLSFCILEALRHVTLLIQICVFSMRICGWLLKYTTLGLSYPCFPPICLSISFCMWVRQVAGRLWLQHFVSHTLPWDLLPSSAPRSLPLNSMVFNENHAEVGNTCNPFMWHRQLGLLNVRSCSYIT